MAEAPLTIKDALDKSTEYLRKKQSSSPRLDAELLLAHILGITRLQLYLQFDRPLSEEEKSKYRDVLKRRGEHEPVAYIIGEKEFMSLSFYVTPAVLVPRPETELLVEEAIKHIEEWETEHPGTVPSIFEVGVGCGAISISLLHHFKDLRIIASDVSADALDVAKQNAERHGVADRFTLIPGDLFAGESGPFDFIIGNPPYLREDEKATLAHDIVRYEPYAALFAGADGMDVVRRIIFEGEKKLSPGGEILLEIGKNQYVKLSAKIESREKFRKVQTVKDYTGVVRCLCLAK